MTRDPGMRAYYQARAEEYDQWWEGTGLHAARERPGWHAEVARLIAVLRALPARRTLDVGCGTGFLTRHLPGEVTGLDQSAAMLDVARERAPHACFVEGDALELPFEDGAFERIFTAHLYGHLLDGERERFLREAWRVAGELVVADTARREEVPAEQWEERALTDGSRHRVYKRFFEPSALAAELGGGEALYAGRWFVVLRSRRPRAG
jgi:ubiquinone/menaquinone biosynthesis C-methylase UbiE